MSKNKLSIKQSASYADAVNYLEDLVKSFKQGKIVVQQGEDFISLTPAENVVVEVEAKQKKDKAKVALEISWYASPEEDEEVVISDTEPEVVPEAESLQEGADDPARSDAEEARRHE